MIIAEFIFKPCSPNPDKKKSNSLVFEGHCRVSVTIIEDKSEETDEYKNKKKQKILKNIVILSVAFFLLFTSYNSLFFLQSSINQDIGINSLSVIYAGMVLSFFFVPSWMIKKWKEKKTIGVCMCGYLFYIAAQFYPRDYTLYPAAFIAGVSAAPMWSAKCTYITQLAKQYSKIAVEDTEIITVRFFGIFLFFLQSTYILGNVISSTVLSMEPTVVLSNDTDRLIGCGVNFCNGDGNDSLHLTREVSTEERYIMNSIYLLCAVLAPITIFIFVDPLARIQDNEREEEKVEKKCGKELLVSTFLHIRKPYQLLIIPLTIFIGIEQAFIGADFTAAYVGCGLGVYMVGYVLICNGVCDATFSLFCTHMVKLLGRVPVFSGGALIQVSLCVVLWTWKPNPEDLFMFYVIAGMWGVSDAVWQTQMTSFYSVLFPKTTEAAFSNFGLWQAVGYIIAFICDAQFCTGSKIYIMIACLAFSMAGYYVIEIIELMKSSPKNDDDRKSLS